MYVWTNNLGKRRTDRQVNSFGWPNGRRKTRKFTAKEGMALIRQMVHYPDVVAMDALIKQVKHSHYFAATLKASRLIMA